MRDLTPSEVGSLLFGIKRDLEIVLTTLSRWRGEGIGPNGMVPLPIIVSETKIKSSLENTEDAIQLIAKLSSVYVDRHK